MDLLGDCPRKPVLRGDGLILEARTDPGSPERALQLGHFWRDPTEPDSVIKQV